MDTMNIINFLLPSKGKAYFILSFVFWLIVEFITVWHSRMSEWLSHMPWGLLQYLLIVLIFYFLFFRLKWSEKKVFIAMLVMIIVFELIWQNSLLLTSYGVLLLISIWGSVTFIPFWIVNKSLREHKWQTIYYSSWILVAIIMGLLLYFKK